MKMLTIGHGHHSSDRSDVQLVSVVPDTITFWGANLIGVLSVIRGYR